MKKFYIDWKKFGIVITAVFLVMLVAVSVLTWLQIRTNGEKELLKKELADCKVAASAGVLPPQEAAKVAVEFINRDLLKNGKAATSDYSAVETSGIYVFKITVDGKDYDTYVTKDGKIMFAQAHKVTEAVVPNPDPAQEPAGAVAK